MAEQSSLSFDLASSSILIDLSAKHASSKRDISDNIRDYLGLTPDLTREENTISIFVSDITSLGRLVQDVLAILEGSSVEVVLDENIQSALSNSEMAELDFVQFSEEARRIRNAESVLDEIPDFIEVVKWGMKRQPYRKQLLASFHITFAKNVANFSVPGTGKTTMVYTAFAAMKSSGYCDEPIQSLLVVGPLSCFTPWQEQYEECFGKEPTSLRVIKDSTDIDFLHSRSQPVELILINYEKMRPGSKFQQGLLSYCRIHNTMLILDEAHRVKNPEGVYANSILPLARTARSRVVLTGTPIPQGFQDLLNIARFLYPDKNILSYSHKRLKKFTKSPERYSREIGRVTTQFEPFFIRLSKSDFNIKPASDMAPIKVEFSNTEERIWNTVEALSKESDSRFSMIRLLQASSNPFLLTEKLNLKEFYGEDEELTPDVSEDDTGWQNDLEVLNPIVAAGSKNVGSKIRACADLVAQLVSRGEKVIVWIVFTDTALRVHKALADLDVKSGALLGKSNSTAFLINGNKSRDDVIQSFKNTRELNCVIANAAAVGESISLHKNTKGEKVCSNAVYLERNFNCAQYLQSRDRIHRVGIGNDVDVKYHFFDTPGTLDKHLDESLKRKSRIMEEFIESEPIPLILLEDSDVMKEVYDSYYGNT